MSDVVNAPPAFSGLSSVTAKTAERANLLAGASGTLKYVLGKIMLEAELRPNSTWIGKWSVMIEVDGHPFTIFMSRTTLLAIVAAMEPSLVLEPPPLPSIIALLADAHLSDVVSQLGIVLGGTATLVGTMLDQLGADDDVAAKLTIAGTPHHIALSGKEVVNRVLRAWPVRRHELSQLRLPSWISLGWTELPIGIVEKLEPGDAVRIEHRRSQSAPSKSLLGQSTQATLLVAGKWSAVVQEREHQWVIMQPPGPTVLRHEEKQMGERDGGNIESLPVRLDFNVGHRELSLAELRRLQPGAVLSLGRSPSDLVEITVHGRRIGTGELVEVEGAAAVRITRLFGLD